MPHQERIVKIQEALKEAGIDGWLFYSFRGSDPFASRVLLIDEKGHSTRRWYYYIPSEGEPSRVVHIIEKERLDDLPGRKLVYLSWKELHAHLGTVLSGSRRVCMQYSPLNAIPYVSCVDGGTIELIRSYGIEVVTSADLIQIFESALSPGQLESHKYAAENLREIMDLMFKEIASRMRRQIPTTEYDLQQAIVKLFEERELITSSEPIVAVNDNAANPHYGPCEGCSREVKEGDFILLDIWAKRKTPHAVYGDITWTGYIGEEVPEKFVDIFTIVRDARNEGLHFIRQAFAEGRQVHGWEVDEVTRRIISSAGYGDTFIHRTGHSIGEETHGTGVNIDNLETQDNRLLIPGSCFSLEPGIYLTGDFGVRSEINVYIQSSEPIVYGQPIQESVVPIMR